VPENPIPDWRFGAILALVAVGALVAGAGPCGRALPVCTGVAWVALWGVGTLGLLGLFVLQVLHRQGRQALLSLLFLALAVARPLFEAFGG